jgi:hypothetical protein
LAWRAFSAFCFTVEVSSSMLEAVSSERPDRSVFPRAISFDAVVIDSDVSRTCETIRARP